MREYCCIRAYLDIMVFCAILCWEYSYHFMLGIILIFFLIYNFFFLKYYF